jgi:signal transduction histidine kinase
MNGPVESKSSLPAAWRWIYQLQSQLILPYVVLTIFVAAIGIFVTTYLVASSNTERFTNRLYETNRVASDSIVRQEQTNLNNLRLMIFTTGVNEAIQYRNVQAVEDLLVPLAANSRVDLVSAIDRSGKEIVTLAYNSSSGQYTRSTGLDFSNLQIVKDILAGKEDQMGDKFTDLVDTPLGKAVLTSAAVRDAKGNFNGVLLVGSRLHPMIEITKNEALADVLLYNLSGTLLDSTLISTDPENKSLSDLLLPVPDAKVNQIIEVSLNGRQYQVVFTPLVIRRQKAGWLGTVLSSDYVSAENLTNRNTFVLLFTLSTLATFLIGNVIARSIARPVEKLNTIAQAVAAGDLEQQTGLKRNDEIGDLAAAFDQMTLRLRERTLEAKNLYQEAIERNQELVRTNEQLRDTQLQLIHSEKMAAVGQLTAGIIHDVKNPIAVIKGFAELLLEDPRLEPDVKKQVKAMRESAIKANRIITDLLTFSRQSEPEMRESNMVETVEAALRMTSFLARESQIHVVTELPTEPVVMRFDPQQIEQVLINLIQNAIQAMSPHGTLTVRLTAQDHRAILAVKDTGVGIPQENLTRIFDPFFTTKPEGEGTGLGLSVSYGIVACHNGKINVQSEPGQGSEFSVDLPMDL